MTAGQLFTLYNDNTDIAMFSVELIVLVPGLGCVRTGVQAAQLCSFPGRFQPHFAITRLGSGLSQQTGLTVTGLWWSHNPTYLSPASA